MSWVVKKVRALDIPAHDYVVIGSGLLDALGLRQAHDLDLAVSSQLFKELKATGLYTIHDHEDGDFLEGPDIEVWQGWKADASFAVLKASALQIDSVYFANPEIIIKRKTERGTPKDLEDIRLLREYQAR
jgi:predicted nuclease of predicted toxin-antitoxin system